MDYYKSILFSQNMKLQRTYKEKTWFGEPKPRDDFTRTIKPNWWFGDGTPTINHGLSRYQHMVIDTDYDNWAVVYGCDTYFVFFHGWYATLLSREPFIEYPYVRAAKDKLDTINYDYGNLWVKTGLSCGFDAAKTLDEVMIDIFKTAPEWNVYDTSKRGTIDAQYLFYGGTDMPYGNIVDSMTWNYWEW